MTPDSNSALLSRIQNRAERTVFLLIFLHGPILLGVGLRTEVNLLPAMIGWAVLAGVAALARARFPNTPATRSLLSAALCVLPALVLLELDGHPWQADAHMHFFVVLALSTAMMDRQAVIVGAAAIALHHLAINFILPSLIYPGGSDLRRVVFHAVVVAFEAGALDWLVSGTISAITATSKAVSENARLAAAGRDAERSNLANAASARRDATLAVATELETALSAVVDNLMTSSEELIAGADTLTDTAMQTWAEAATSKENSESASESVQTVAAATDDIAANITEITTRVAEAAAASDLAFTEAKATHDTVNELADGASKIGHVVQLIGNIASQTNLLALNATIEAARAGEQGKGFAVVASEVKTLAAATASATNEVAAQIANMQQITRRAVETIKTISGSVERASTVTSSIAGAIEKQRVATQHIAAAALQATAGTAGVSTAVGTLSAAIREATETIGMLRVVGMTVAEHGQSLQSEVSNLSERLRQQANSEWEAENSPP